MLAVRASCVVTQQCLKHVDTVWGRHGKPFRYYRPNKKGGRIRLRGEPGTAEFLRSYEDAVLRMALGDATAVRQPNKVAGCELVDARGA